MSLTKAKYDEKIIAISHAKRINGRKNVYNLNREQEEYFKNNDDKEIKSDTRKLYKDSIRSDVDLYKSL